MMHDSVCTILIACLCYNLVLERLPAAQGRGKNSKGAYHVHSLMHGYSLPHEVLTSRRTSSMFDDFKSVFELSVESPKVVTKSPFFIFIFVISHIHVSDLKRNSRDETPFASIMSL